MKVIAKVSDDKVLCEVSTIEIARLRNCTSTSDKNWSYQWVTVGTEHDLAQAFRTLDTLRTFDPSQLKHVKYNIDAMNAQFEKIKETYEKLMLLDTLKELPESKE
jgi:hypothetical protein